MEILLIRHGESEADILKVHEGRADFTLTEHGRRQAQEMAKVVKEKYLPEVIWASTLKRARETAEILSWETGISVIEDDGLREFNNGVLAGLPFAEAKLRYPEPEGGRMPHVRIEDGESELEFRFRAQTVFSKILAESAGRKRIAIVSHGGMISNLLRAFLNLPVSCDTYFPTGDTGIHLLRLNGGQKTVMFLNDCGHLAKVDSERLALQ
ncbi:histidine phosphatase family protein [Mesobacillus subterraneus]|uniref:Histidine phosphatase family protein n=1 Tax=Mesobacillus subterraneus TaxID=285983 RepID=A0A3R9FSK8_9BACI|nr:histidine phosphatase family protein [Mesobacillus subterraneus]RSD23256.1 histidine phosphatase family protein [Mesobacillus subterraneus]